MDINLKLPQKLAELFKPTHTASGKLVRYRGAYGGRGSGKSIGFSDMAIVRMIADPMIFLCCRELQNSIKESVHSLILDRIEALGVGEFFESGESYIRRIDGRGQFLFKGLRSNAAEIKSMNGVKICWVEEAQATSQKSLEFLLPTIREDGSEIWFSWNPNDEEDPVHDMLVTNTPDNAVVAKINWGDNPFFPQVLEDERQRVLKYQPSRYEWIWEGNFNVNTDGSVYGKWINKADSDGRIKSGIYDPDLPVHTAWDLGYSDDTAIVYWQQAGNEVRIIDYYENNREGIKHYIEMLFGREIIVTQYGDNGRVLKWKFGKDIEDHKYRKQYKYGTHYVPHDAANKLLQAGGRSMAHQAHEYGVKMHVVGATSQQNQIEALRVTLEKTWFDFERCKPLVRALRKYQFLFDDVRNRYLDKPDHDQYSHACDAIEIVAQVWKSVIISEDAKKPKTIQTITADELFWGDDDAPRAKSRI